MELVRKVNGKWKLLIDPTVMDTNFDGSITYADVLTLRMLMGQVDKNLNK